MRHISTFFMTLLFFSSMTLPAMAGTGGWISTGQKAPQFQVRDINKSIFNLKEGLKTGPIILVFYRGGWCPYCNTQLRSLQKDIVPKLKEKNARLVAISVDSVDEALKTKNSEKLNMTIISDSDALIIEKYKVDFKVPLSLVKKYKNNYKIDLEKASQRKHHIIAIPAIYVVAKDGHIVFSYANEDYKVRAQNQDIIKALKKL